MFGTAYHTQKLASDGGAPAPALSCGFHYGGVDDVDATYRELTAAGFALNEQPFNIPPGPLVTLNDPDGNIVGFIDNSKGGMPGQHA